MYPDGPYRVWNGQGTGPGLAIGDGVAQMVGVSPEPDSIDHTVDMSRDRILILCSDGVWEFIISSREAAEIAGSCTNAKDASVLLQKEARRRWESEEGGYCDDITAAAAFLR